MNAKFSRTAAALSIAAALSLAATPALGRDRNWGGGWGDDWGRHHDRIDAGDVLAGVLIIGGIAAIASAASNSSKAKRQRSDDYRYRDRDDSRSSYPRREDSAGYGNDDHPANSQSRGENRGLDNAVDRCASEVERGDRRIDEIDTVSRENDGWRVQGRIVGGTSFACTVGRDGRVSNVNVDDSAI